MVSQAAVAADASLGPQPNLLGYRYIYRNIHPCISINFYKLKNIIPMDLKLPSNY